VAKNLEYLMDQGIQYEVLRKREVELKAKVPSGYKVSDENPLDEGYLATFKQLFAEEQARVRS
jgi:hypothetical protein